MRTRLIAILCVLSSTVFLAGCETNNTQTAAVSQEVEPAKNTVPNPKKRPKSDPVYPSAERVVAWHANQCGGFKVKPSLHTYLGEKELKRFFKFMCVFVVCFVFHFVFEVEFVFMLDCVFEFVVDSVIGFFVVFHFVFTAA